MDFNDITKVFSATDKDIVNGTLVIPEGNILVLFYSVSDLSKIKKIVFPKSFKIIPDDFAIELTNLSEIEFGGNEEIIGNSAFANTKIKRIEFPDSVREVKWQAFANCEELESVVLPVNRNFVMYEEVFKDSNNIKDLVIKDGFLVLTDNVFPETKITSLTLPKTCSYFAIDQFMPSLENLELYASTSLSDISSCKSKLKNLILHTGKNTYIFSSNNGVAILDSKKNQKLIQVFDENNQRKLFLADNEEMSSIDPKKFDFVMDKVCSILEIEGAKIAKLLQEGKLTESQVKNANGRIINRCIYSMGEEGIQKYFDAQKSYFICKRLLIDSGAIYSESSLYNACKIMGLFNGDEKIRNKIVGTFAELKDLEKKGSYFSSFMYNLDHLDEKFDPYFAEFLLKNYKEILKTDSLQILPFAQSNFEEIRMGYKNKSGKLKVVTLDAINQYFIMKNLTSLKGVDDSKFILDVAKYFVNQVENIPTLYRYHKLATKNQKEIDENKCEDYFSGLKDDSDSKYKFEFLRKDKNEFVILGNICDCCARVGGVGESILYDTCVDYRRTFLVIRNENDEIVAKCSLTYQKNENILVFNNIEINQYYKANEMTVQDKFTMLECLQRSAKAFKDNVSTAKPFACIIGTNLTNDLYDVITTRTDDVLSTIHIEAYSNYDPDASLDQHYLYRDDDFVEGDWSEDAYLELIYDRYGIRHLTNEEEQEDDDSTQDDNWHIDDYK